MASPHGGGKWPGLWFREEDVPSFRSGVEREPLDASGACFEGVCFEGVCTEWQHRTTSASWQRPGV